MKKVILKRVRRCFVRNSVAEFKVKFDFTIRKSQLNACCWTVIFTPFSSTKLLDRSHTFQMLQIYFIIPII
jgi:hypothetical protein